MMARDPLQGQPTRQRERDAVYAEEWFQLVCQVASNWARTRVGCSHGMMAATLRLAAQLGRSIGMQPGDFQQLAGEVFVGLPPAGKGNGT